MDSRHLRRSSRYTVLTIPGLGGSGPAHWQTFWEAERTDTVRVELGCWDRPLRNVWISRIDQAVRRCSGPVILAAHSLGCIAVAWWAGLSPDAVDGKVAGALLVAPADADRLSCPAKLKTFAPCPDRTLPFPSLLVASHDDPWMSLDEAARLAAAWGSRFVDAGASGHINADSGLGAWNDGQRLLEDVMLARTGSGSAPASGTTYPA